jgi:hypothetical protein
MKKVGLRILLGIFLFLGLSVRTFAIEASLAPINSVVDTTIPANQPTIDYTLPYPGMLTNHPLYFLKQVRDQLMLTFINDPVAKTQFYLLQSDKFLSMAMTYANTKNASLEIKNTVLQADANMNLAVDTAQKYKSNGGSIPAFIWDRLVNSIDKHIQVISGFESKSLADKSIFSEEIESLTKLKSVVISLR